VIDTSRLMVSVSGVRGRVGDGLTPEVIATFAAAFGAYVRSRGPGNTVVLGRDYGDDWAKWQDRVDKDLLKKGEAQP
jgi:phosphomannomutase